MGKRNITVNGVAMDIPHELAAGSLKEMMGAAPEDWVFAKPLDGRHYHIPDNDLLPHEVSDFLIVPKFEFGAGQVPVLVDWDRRQLLNRLAAEAAFLERNRNYGTVDDDTEAATWFSVAA